MADSQKMDLNQLVSKNQSIKIVPSVEESLQAIGLNVQLDDNTKIWFDQMKLTWRTWKKSPAVENQIERFLLSVPDPHRVALIFVIKSEDFKDCKPKTLPYCIIETLQKCAQRIGVNPEDSLKLPAFRIAIQQRNQNFLKLMVKTYKIGTIKDQILPIVREMIKDDNSRQASQIIMAMELFDDIPVEDLLFPLILQDKNHMIDEYLLECPTQVKQLLQFLDRLLDKKINIRDYVQQYIEENKVSHIKYEKLHYKPLGKMVARLCNKFNIPIETCKNLSKNRTTGGLRYLIHQKYQENNVSSTVWEDLVKDSLKQNADSAKEFIDLLLDYDKKEALKWAEYLQIPESDLPLALKDMSLEEPNNEEEEESWDTSTKPGMPQTYYKLSLPINQVIMIDTGENFYDLMMSYLTESGVVSIDCEWKPSFGATQSQVALIQIATQKNVYLIDALILNRPEYSSFWYTFHKSILDNAEIIKVGFGLEQDLREMKASISGLNNIKVKGEGLLDLCSLWKTLIDNGLVLPGNSETGGSSLSSLVQTCFGSPLEKSEQCSNWELRPLRETQVLYAALDAYVLLEIYYYLQQLSQHQEINYEEICNDVMLEGKKKNWKKTKPSETTQQECNKKMFAKSTKLFVDPNISHLASYLRYCGLDTTIISTTMLWHDLINTAISEDRLVLLPKLKCSPTNNYPQTSILDVGEGTIKDQLQRIMSNYNISVTRSDILSICISCNSKQLKKLMPHEVGNLCTEYQNTKNVKINYRDSDDEDAEYTNFLSDSDCDEDYLQPVTNVCNNQNKCKTSKGAVIDISDPGRLIESQKPAILCEDCGKLLWDEDPLVLTAANMISSVTKISI